MVFTLKVVMMIHVNNASVGMAILSVDPKLVAQLIVRLEQEINGQSRAEQDTVPS
jgi:hypothetical protein